MEQTTFPIYKSPPMKSLLSSYLITSTLDSHQISKRIKGLFGYSEHYKGSRVDYPNLGPKFSPLRTRDYHKAQELTLEIWDPMIQISFLEKFLKSQRNLHTIRIQVLTKKEYRREILKRLCEILCKIGRLNRVYIDFDTEQERQVKPELSKRVRSMRKLPRLKDLNVTVDGKQVLPFSSSLVRVGFDGENGSLEVAPNVHKLIQKTPKFYQLDTIRIDTKHLELESPDSFLDALVLVISKLPNFLELDFNDSKGFNFSLEQAVKILDSLVKAPKFEILRLGFASDARSQISLLKHPLFKAKSLKRTSFSFYFDDNELATSEDLDDIFDLLGEIPSLYELSLRFSKFFKIDDGTAEMWEIWRMTSIRKLKIMFDAPSFKLNEKQAENIFKLVFKMQFLEELYLWLPQDCLEGNARDIQGLPRLKKASLHFERPKSTKANGMKRIAEILGKCHQLRELEFKVSDGVDDYQGLTMKLIESLRKLKKLQVFEFFASTSCKEGCNMTMDYIDDLLETCHQLRYLQDFRIDARWGLFLKEFETFQRRYSSLLPQLKRNKKYRRAILTCL